MKNKLHPTLSSKYFIISSVLCIIFLTYSITFILYTTNQNNKNNIISLSNAAKQVKTSISKQIVGDFQTLNGVSVCIGTNGLSDKESIDYILANVNADNTFSKMGLANLDGEASLVDLGGLWDYHLSLAQYDFFQSAVNGEDAISDTIEDPFAPGTYINFYCVPVHNMDNEVIAVLCAVNDGSMYREIVDTPLINDKGYSCILNSSGDFMIRSARMIPSASKSLRISELGTFASQQTELIEEALASTQSTFYSFKADGETYDAILLPLDIKNWYLTSFISKSELNKNFHVTAYGTISLIAVAFFIFTVLFAQQRSLVAKNHAVLYKLAYTDELTGSRNYKKFQIDTEEILKKNIAEHYAIWYLDLKRFKYLNDVYGYETGDLLLKNLCQILNQNLKQNDIYCRISADNFAGLCFYKDTVQLEDWFSSVLNDFRSKKIQSINTSSLDLCAGFYCPQDFNSPLPLDDMVNRANMAQKDAKDKPGSHYVYFSGHMRKQISQETELTAEAQVALDNKEFVLYFQPKANIQENNLLAGAEVLVRWVHPAKGLISPGIFIPLFEKSDMIIKLDRFVFEQACIWFHSYLAAGNPEITLSVNVSRIGMVSEDFLEYYISLKDKYQIPDKLLELEFTESILSDDNHMFLNTITQLQKHGFICSIDDFGSGFSSLNVLKDLPFDVLKLDMMFFQNSRDRSRERIVISNIIHMATELNIKTVAEGVESIDNVEFLQHSGCDIVQGYIFSQPISMESFDHFVKKYRYQPLEYTQKG